MMMNAEGGGAGISLGRFRNARPSDEPYIAPQESQISGVRGEGIPARIQAESPGREGGESGLKN